MIYQGGGWARRIPRVDWLMNYLLAGELFTKINHKPTYLHYKFNIFSTIFVPLFQVT